MVAYQRNPQEWLDIVREDIVDPQREIVDPHHHLWSRPEWTYELDELWADTGDGHRVVQTVFVECRSGYRSDGPEHLRPLGETEYVAAIAAKSAQGPGATIAGIVAHADLRADPDELAEVLDGHTELGGELFKGIRHAGASDQDPDALTIAGRAPADLYVDPAFQRGVAELGVRGLTYDTWHYHHQLPAFTELAAAVPDTVMVLDHLGTPLGVGRFAHRREEIFDQWRLDIEAVAARPNVVAKLGGMAMIDNGFGWNERSRPPTSDEFVAAQGRYYEHMIESFGPSRCMFESNFPVDRLSVSYQVCWNALKKIAAPFSDAEIDEMFHGTARRVYRL